MPISGPLEGRVWGAGRLTPAHGQDIWIDVHENDEFPDSPEPTDPAPGARSFC